MLDQSGGYRDTAFGRRQFAVYLEYPATEDALTMAPPLPPVTTITFLSIEPVSFPGITARIYNGGTPNQIDPMLILAILIQAQYFPIQSTITSASGKIVEGYLGGFDDLFADKGRSLAGALFG